MMQIGTILVELCAFEYDADRRLIEDRRAAGHMIKQASPFAHRTGQGKTLLERVQTGQDRTGQNPRVSGQDNSPHVCPVSSSRIQRIQKIQKMKIG